MIDSVTGLLCGLDSSQIILNKNVHDDFVFKKKSQSSMLWKSPKIHLKLLCKCVNAIFKSSLNETFNMVSH